MHDKIILITGSTDGIGKQTALRLARTGATIIIHGRNKDKCNKTRDEIINETGNDKVDCLTADISTRQGTESLAAAFLQKYERLDVLINNAGVFMKERKLTADGLEMTFAVNHMSYFIVTHKLLPVLMKSSPSRIINVSSIAHQNGRIHFDNLQGEKRFEGYQAYALSKLANILFTVELADKLKGAGVTVNALHPGVISTKLLATGFGSQGAPVEEGAETPVYLATSDEVKEITGKYFIKCRQSKYSPIADDENTRKQFWRLSEKLAGINN